MGWLVQNTMFLKNGWCRFPYDPAVADWVERTLPSAQETVTAPENAEWLRHGETWFAGVNVLPNDRTGAVADGVPLAGSAVDFIQAELGLNDFDWEPAQVSVCYPGYPQQSPDESDAAHRYRVKRDAAHVDGLIPEGPQRRRHLREIHGFVLGIPMVEASADAAPLVVWNGSHEIIRQAFSDLFAGLPPEAWGDVDATDVYQATRRQIFETCERVTVSAKPGETYLIHRLALHGVAPWEEGAEAGPDGRMIVYFRPEVGGPGDWLGSP